MDILQGVDYFYTTNGRQVGPIEGTQVLLLAQQGQILVTDNLWAEGMAEWLPAAAFNQLAPVFQRQDPAVQDPSVEVKEGASIVREPSLTRPGVILMPREEEVPERYRKGAKFGLLMTLLSLGVLCYAARFAGLVTIGDISSSASPEMPELSSKMGLLYLAAMTFAMVFLVSYSIVSLVYLHRVWSHIQELGTARTTPGKAIGFLFIPFFNLYWMFIAYSAWAEDFNKYSEGMGADYVRRASPGLGIAFCVLALLGLPVLHPFLMAHICRSINEISDLPAPEDLGIETGF
tara:strand:+ start:1661 stop:2530 length:870 start_codon:yes stop_codon:yes gene_type:complete